MGHHHSKHAVISIDNIAYLGIVQKSDPTKLITLNRSDTNYPINSLVPIEQQITNKYQDIKFGKGIVYKNDNAELIIKMFQIVMVPIGGITKPTDYSYMLKNSLVRNIRGTANYVIVSFTYTLQKSTVVGTSIVDNILANPDILFTFPLKSNYYGKGVKTRVSYYSWNSLFYLESDTYVIDDHVFNIFPQGNNLIKIVSKKNQYLLYTSSDINSVYNFKLSVDTKQPVKKETNWFLIIVLVLIFLMLIINKKK